MAVVHNPENPSAEQVREQLAYDPATGRLWFKARPAEKAWWVARFAEKEAGYLGNHGYICVPVRGMRPKTYMLAHRLAWVIHYGGWPIGVVDHINGRRADNRIVNLRDVTKAENCFHRLGPPRGASGVRGVRRAGSAWVAYIGTRYLGRFPSLDDAALAREQAEQARLVQTLDQQGRIRT